MAAGGSADAGVHADEDGDEVGGEGVEEMVGDVGVCGWGGVAGGGSFSFGGGRGG